MKICIQTIYRALGIGLCAVGMGITYADNTVKPYANQVHHKNSAHTKNKGTYNQLNKVFHHRSVPDVASVAKVLDMLEFGHVVLYFDKPVSIKPLQYQKPGKAVGKPALAHMGEIVPIIEKKHDITEVTVVFPSTKINPVAEAMIHTLNRLPKMPYQVTIKHADTTITIVISYNANKVVLECESFVAIDGNNGVLFRFLSKELLDALRNKGHSMLRTAQVKKKRGIVVDCGHGGTDGGAIGISKLQEKQVTLDVGLYLAQLLAHDGYEVFLTRDCDTTVALDQRTTQANNTDADLFISIHANYSQRPTASGIEVFSLQDSLFKLCFSDAAPATLALAHNVLHKRAQRSCLLASCVHDALMGAIKKKYADVVDRGIKHKVSQVLVGTTKPAILVELGFLSNPVEEARLADDTYRQQLALAMHDGITHYFETVSS